MTYRIIKRYDLQPGRSTLDLYAGSVVLSVGVDQAGPYFHAMCDPRQHYETAVFFVFGTDRQLPVEIGNYVGAIQGVPAEFLSNIHPVYHVFTTADTITTHGNKP